MSVPPLRIESMSEAAGRCAAAATTRYINARTHLPPNIRDVDPAELQSMFAAVFEQGVNWSRERANVINQFLADKS